MAQLKYKCASCDSIVSSEKSTSPKDDIAVDIFKNNRDSIIELVADFKSNSTAGTGILLSNNYVITNAHILLDNDNVAESIFGLFNNDRKGIELDLIAIDEELDIAILKFSNHLYKPLLLKDITPITGEKVYAIGNAIGQGLTIVEGIISDAKRIVNKHEFILHSAPVNHGNSGGPLFNSQGEIIGMITSSRKDAKNMSYAIPNRVILSFLKDYISNTR